MCLAIPGKIVAINGQQAVVDFDGVRKEINVSLVSVKVGEYVIVHAGFAIEKLNQKEAFEIIDAYES
ncbi:HypC/HybG/HupF family hydrogenase formation chaperone [Patescibacteria group bacterium]|nr:MAG: HypC/HybG/HupF family hydrogenase formation chaperone [Patescibacteria group bacterium]